MGAVGVTMQNLIVDVRITHNRVGDRDNRFSYRAFYVALPLSILHKARTLLFSLNRFNLFSFNAADHGDGGDAEIWARDILHRRGLVHADGEIVLITLPRVLGYVFNPVSFWLCYDKEQRLRAIIAEVNNTLGGRHVYVCANADARPIQSTDSFSMRKAFPVSPFLSDAGEYTFHFDARQDQFCAWINFIDDSGPRLNTNIIGRMAPLNDAQLILGFARIPFMTLKVVTLIYWQALKLIFKSFTIRHHSSVNSARAEGEVGRVGPSKAR